MELYKKKVSYISSKDNKEHTTYNYYLKVDGLSGLIAVKASFYQDNRLLNKVAKDILIENVGD